MTTLEHAQALRHLSPAFLCDDDNFHTFLDSIRLVLKEAEKEEEEERDKIFDVVLEIVTQQIAETQAAIAAAQEEARELEKQIGNNDREIRRIDCSLSNFYKERDGINDTIEINKGIISDIDISIGIHKEKINTFIDKIEFINRTEDAEEEMVGRLRSALKDPNLTDEQRASLNHALYITSGGPEITSGKAEGQLQAGYDGDVYKGAAQICRDKKDQRMTDSLEARKEIDAHLEQVGKLDARKAELMAEVEAGRKRLEEIQPEIDKLEADRARLVEENAELQTRLEGVNARIEGLEARRDALMEARPQIGMGHQGDRAAQALGAGQGQNVITASFSGAAAKVDGVAKVAGAAAGAEAEVAATTVARTAVAGLNV